MRLWERLLCFKKSKATKVEQEARALAKYRRQQRKIAKYAKEIVHDEMIKAVPNLYEILLAGGIANVIVRHEVDDQGTHFVRFHTSTALQDENDYDETPTNDFEDLEDHGTPSNDFEDLETFEDHESQLSPNLLEGEEIKQG